MNKILLFVSLWFQNTLCANILYISPVPSPSHHIWNRALAFGLAEKGHNVTLLGPDKDKTSPKNYHSILIEGLYEEFHDSVHMIDMAEYSATETVKHFVDVCLLFCNSSLKTEGLRKLLNYPINFKFDLIILDVSIGSCFYPVIHAFNYPPAIAVTPFLLPSYVAYNFGNHLYPNYIPWYSLPYGNDMSILERFWNFLFAYGQTALRNIYEYKEEHALAKKVFGENVPAMDELERHISLVLTNTDPVLDRPQPLTPNFIAVGGLHTKKSKPLPQDLQNILDGAKNGVIVFSLGSNIQSDALDKIIQKELLKAFSKRPELVIWKFESELENLPKNVIIKKWLPQNDILGHSNVKLFIGHGGALSTQEAIYHGVPMICVPFFMDQHVNSRNIVERKLGISLDFRLISSEYVSGKIREILGNPIYRTNMQKTSLIFRDQTETPLERAIFWTEYAIRHDGAQFLNSPGRDLPFYKSAFLDLVIFAIIICTTVILILYKILRGMFRLLLGSVKKVKVN